MLVYFDTEEHSSFHDDLPITWEIPKRGSVMGILTVFGQGGATIPSPSYKNNSDRERH